MNALMPRSGCPSNNRRPSSALAWPFMHTCSHHAAFFLLGERTKSVFVTHRFEGLPSLGLPNAHLWFLLTKGRNSLQFFYVSNVDSTQLMIIPGSPQDVGISQTFSVCYMRNVKSRKTTKKMKFWLRCSYFWSRGELLDGRTDDFIGRKVISGFFGRTAAGSTGQECSSERGPKQAEHLSRHITGAHLSAGLRMEEHRQNIWLLTFIAQLSKLALQEIRRVSFLADWLSF